MIDFDKFSIFSVMGKEAGKQNGGKKRGVY